MVTESAAWGGGLKGRGPPMSSGSSFHRGRGPSGGCVQPARGMDIALEGLRISGGERPPPGWRALPQRPAASVPWSVTVQALPPFSLAELDGRAVRVAGRPGLGKQEMPAHP